MLTWNNREEWLHHFVKLCRPIFLEKGYTLPEKIRVGVSWSARGGMRGKSIGECWTDSASKDGTTEIFVSPKLDDSMRIAGVLTHELCHAAVGIKAGHGPIFAKCAKALGLEGKMTATTEGPEWHKVFGPIIDQMGPMPHATISGDETSAKPKQSTRMIKCTCDTCGMVFRTSKKWLTPADEADDEGDFDAELGLRCPKFSCEGMVNVDLPEGDGGDD